MKFWFTKKSSSDDVAMMKAIPVPEQLSVTAKADSSISADAYKPASSEPSTEKSATSAQAPFAIAPQTLGARRDKQQIPNDRRDLYYNLMNSLYDAVLILDEDGQVVDCNERAEYVLDYTKDDLWDLSVSTIIPAINAQVFNQMKEGLHGKRRVLINAHCHRKDGSTFPGEVGAGLMTLIGENLVLTVRNIEKRLPARAIFKPTPLAEGVEPSAPDENAENAEPAATEASGK